LPGKWAGIGPIGSGEKRRGRVRASKGHEDAQPGWCVMTAVARGQAAETQPSPKWMIWTGWVLSALPVLGMVASASMKLAHAPQFVEMWVGKLGYQEGAL